MDRFYRHINIKSKEAKNSIQNDHFINFCAIFVHFIRPDCDFSLEKVETDRKAMEERTGKEFKILRNSL